jgi:hypothetical protein
MSLEPLSVALGMAGSILVYLLTIAVAWGKINAVVQNLSKVVEAVDEKVTRCEQQDVAQNVTIESHGERLDRLELPLFQRRH